MIQLHMHQIKEFIDNRYRWYDKYINGRTYKAMDSYKIAWDIGSAVDLEVKYFHLNKGKQSFNSDEYKRLKPDKQALVMGMVLSYVNKYKNSGFTDFKQEFFRAKLGKYQILCSPDLTARTYFTKKLAIIEIKTGEVHPALNFQTACYAWGYWKTSGELPAYVLKRTIRKPRIKQKKNESLKAFQKRSVLYDYKVKAEYCSITKDTVLSFEKYLKNILREMFSKDKYKFYMNSNDDWRLRDDTM